MKFSTTFRSKCFRTHRRKIGQTHWISYIDYWMQLLVCQQRIVHLSALLVNQESLVSINLEKTIIHILSKIQFTFLIL